MPRAASMTASRTAKRSLGWVDSRFRGNDKWEVAAARSWAQFAMPLFGHPGRRPGIHVLTTSSERASYVLRAGWIPAYAGMTIPVMIMGDNQVSTNQSILFAIVRST